MCQQGDVCLCILAAITCIKVDGRNPVCQIPVRWCLLFFGAHNLDDDRFVSWLPLHAIWLMVGSQCVKPGSQCQIRKLVCQIRKPVCQIRKLVCQIRKPVCQIRKLVCQIPVGKVMFVSLLAATTCIKVDGRKPECWTSVSKVISVCVFVCLTFQHCAKCISGTDLLRLAISSTHNTLTPGQPVLALTLKRQALGQAATELLIF